MKQIPWTFGAGLLALAIAVTVLAPSFGIAETINCTPITSAPYVIPVSGSGVYCLTGDLLYRETTGNAIEVLANNVTIELNGWKLKNHGLDTGTQAVGVYANNVRNVTIKNGTILGFMTGVELTGNSFNSSSGYLVENLLVDQSRSTGIEVQGSGCVVRNNRVLNTGNGNGHTKAAGIVAAGDGMSVSDNLIDGVSQAGNVGAWIEAFGIHASGGTIERNRIRGISSSNAAPLEVTLLGALSHGIFVSGGAVIRDNFISDETAQSTVSALSYGIETPTITFPGLPLPASMIRGNEIVDVEVGITADSVSLCKDNLVIAVAAYSGNCTDAGGNFPAP